MPKYGRSTDVHGTDGADNLSVTLFPIRLYVSVSGCAIFNGDFLPRPGPTAKIRLDKGMGVILTNYLHGARSTFWNSAAMFRRHTS